MSLKQLESAEGRLEALPSVSVVVLFLTASEHDKMPESDVTQAQMMSSLHTM